MILLPIFFGFMFFLTLLFKMIGGHIAWWIIITLGVFFVVPIIIFFIAMFFDKRKEK